MPRASSGCPICASARTIWWPDACSWAPCSTSSPRSSTRSTCSTTSTASRPRPGRPPRRRRRLAPPPRPPAPRSALPARLALRCDFSVCLGLHARRFPDIPETCMRSFHFPGRSLVYGRRAMCATSHPAASLTAIETIRQGGNAVDAAIATAAVLAVVEPHMTGVGGDCFALIAKPSSRKLIALNAAGRAPKAATAAWLAKANLARIEPDSVHAVTVPGAISGWMRLLEDHGSQPLDRLLQPAIALAQEGFAVPPRVASD